MCFPRSSLHRFSLFPRRLLPGFSRPSRRARPATSPLLRPRPICSAGFLSSLDSSSCFPVLSSSLDRVNSPPLSGLPRTSVPTGLSPLPGLLSPLTRDSLNSPYLYVFPFLNPGLSSAPRLSSSLFLRSAVARVLAFIVTMRPMTSPSRSRNVSAIQGTGCRCRPGGLRLGGRPE